MAVPLARQDSLPPFKPNMHLHLLPEEAMAQLPVPKAPLKPPPPPVNALLSASNTEAGDPSSRVHSLTARSGGTTAPRIPSTASPSGSSSARSAFITINTARTLPPSMANDADGASVGKGPNQLARAASEPVLMPLHPVGDTGPGMYEESLDPTPIDTPTPSSLLSSPRTDPGKLPPILRKIRVVTRHPTRERGRDRIRKRATESNLLDTTIKPEDLSRMNDDGQFHAEDFPSYYQRWLEMMGQMDDDQVHAMKIRRPRSTSPIMRPLSPDMDPHRVPAVVLASSVNMEEVVVDMVEGNPRCIDDEDGRMRTALHWAVHNHNQDLVSYLLDNGAQMDQIDYYGRDAVGYAVHHLHNTDVPMLELLMERCTSRKIIQRVFMTAVKFDFFEITIMLLQEKGADVNHVDEVGYTALHYAVKAGSLNMIRFLVYNGADITMQDARGRLPIDLVIKTMKNRGDYRVILELLDPTKSILWSDHGRESLMRLREERRIR